MQRPIPAVLCSLAVLAASLPAFALKQPYCSSTVTCTGGTPELTVGTTGGLAHPVVIPIYWAGYSTWWEFNSLQNQRIVGELQYLLNGPYFAALSQYGQNASGLTGVGPGRLSQGMSEQDLVGPPSPILESCTSNAQCVSMGSAGNTCAKNNTTGAYQCRLSTAQAESLIGEVINATISESNVAPPSSAVDSLYVVFLPPIATMDLGFPQVDANYPWTYDSVRYNASWVYGKDSVGLSAMMADSIAGNVKVTNCTYTSTGAVANQVADLCACHTETQMGLSHQAYWSASDGACVIPEAWTNVYQYDDATTDWNRIGGPVRQVYAGETGGGVCAAPPCIIATGTDDNLYEYTGGGSWSELGQPGVMYALGQGDILSIDENTNLSRWNGSTWTSIGAPNGPGSVIMSVYSGAVDVVTQPGGQVFLYEPSSPTGWGGPAAPFDVEEVIVGDAWSAALDYGRNVWLLLPGPSGYTWTNANHTGSELFVGGWQSLGVRDLTSARGLDAMTTTLTGGSYVLQPWWSFDSAAIDWALSGDPGCAHGRPRPGHEHDDPDLRRDPAHRGLVRLVGPDADAPRARQAGGPGRQPLRSERRQLLTAAGPRAAPGLVLAQAIHPGTASEPMARPIRRERPSMRLTMRSRAEAVGASRSASASPHT